MMVISVQKVVHTNNCVFMVLIRIRKVNLCAKIVKKDITAHLATLATCMIVLKDITAP